MSTRKATTLHSPQLHLCCIVFTIRSILSHVTLQPKHEPNWTASRLPSWVRTLLMQIHSLLHIVSMLVSRAFPLTKIIVMHQLIMLRAHDICGWKYGISVKLKLKRFIKIYQEITWGDWRIFIKTLLRLLMMHIPNTRTLYPLWLGLWMCRCHRPQKLDKRAQSAARRSFSFTTCRMREPQESLCTQRPG